MEDSIKRVADDQGENFSSGQCGAVPTRIAKHVAEKSQHDHSLPAAGQRWCYQ